MRGQQWINLAITIEDYQLDFRLSNSKPLQEKIKKGKKGIGLSNVQKRLDLLYPGKYMLNIESSNHQYSVHMQVRLHQYAEPDSLTRQILNPSN
jgi:sensor histidine kinase YesM